MRAKFLLTSNVGRFVKAARQVEARAVPEHAIMVVAGEAGLGKSRTGLWWALQQGAVITRVSPLASPAWVLRDLVRELGDTPKRSAEQLKLQACGLLVAQPRPIVVDEVEHALDRGALALDALREISDLCEVPLILIGREATAEKLRRHRQIWRRIGAVAQFQPVSLADVRAAADELAEVAVGDDVVAAIHAACEGRICTAIAGIAAAEKAGRALDRPVTLADVDARALGHPWAGRDARVVGLARRKPAQAGSPGQAQGAKTVAAGAA